MDSSPVVSTPPADEDNMNPNQHTYPTIEGDDMHPQQNTHSNMEEGEKVSQMLKQILPHNNHGLSEGSSCPTANTTRSGRHFRDIQ
jgi:hypothetical protein